MPAVAIATPNVTFALRFDFGSWSLSFATSGTTTLAANRRTQRDGQRDPRRGLSDAREQPLRITR
jgi:hypothetical protein